MKIKMSPDKRQAELFIKAKMNAQELSALIVDLATLRADMLPEVAANRRELESVPDAPICLEPDAEMSVALLTDGSFRLWARNRGIGWMLYDVSADSARGMATYILSGKISNGNYPEHGVGNPH